MFTDQLVYTLKRPFHFVKTGLLRGLPAEIKYRFPARKLKIICFTGTDGKTTSSTLMYHVLKQAGYKVALLSTVAAYVGDQEYDTGFHVTSPDPADLHRFMKMMVDEGYEYLVLEATSHGIYQFRTWGIRPLIAGVTNIANEHLDYHLTYENYLAAKASLLYSAQLAIVNADDQSHTRLRKALRGGPRVIEYSQEMELEPVVSKAIRNRFPEAYNHANSRLVTTAAKQLGVTADVIAQAIKSFPGVPGRMQFVTTKQSFDVVVDFAHTPQALEAALTSLRTRLHQQQRNGRLIAIFGCAGLRDRSKRPAMAKIATELADLAIFTAEDPRTEDIWSIIHQMKSGVETGHEKIISIPDRRTAIQTALTEIAKPGDVISIFGKGHERSMCYGTTEYPWHDATVVEEILADLK